MKTDANEAASGDDRDETTADDADVRYGLTALGEALLRERGKGRRFRGFGPCAVAALRTAG